MQNVLEMYPPWWNDNISLFNRFEVNGLVFWHRTRLSGCFFQKVESTHLNGLEKSDRGTSTCRIRENESYLDPDEWEALRDKGYYFTLRPEDIIVLGNTPDINESIAGQRSSDLLENNRYAFRITDTAVNIKGGSPHYKALGEIRQWK